MEAGLFLDRSLVLELSKTAAAKGKRERAVAILMVFRRVKVIDSFFMGCARDWVVLVELIYIHLSSAT